MVLVSSLSSCTYKNFFGLVANENKNRILLNVLYCAKINRDKANGKYDKYIGYGDDRDPSFRLVL